MWCGAPKRLPTPQRPLAWCGILACYVLVLVHQGSVSTSDSSSPVPHCPPTQIHDHTAFDNREAILASLAPALLQRGAYAQHPCSRQVLLTSCAVEGCLQLVFTASTLDGSDPFALPPGDDVSPFLRQLHAQLPDGCVDDLVTIHLDDTLAVFTGGTGQQLPPELLHLPSSDSGNRLQWAPVCFEAGLQEEVEVEVTCSMMGPGVEVAVRYASAGQVVAEKLPVETVPYQRSVR
jgi:hypothetical protein